MRNTRWLLVFVAGLLLFSGRLAAQEINLDKTVRAGGLQLFQDYKDPLMYYYLPNRAGLAMTAEGLPQFSFLRYVRNVAGAAGADAPIEGEGGGIAHGLVQLAVPDEMVSDARRELQRIVPGAKIAGPIIYRSGRVALISSFKQDNGELTQKVVGLGNAPILEGDKAAVSIQLTKQGATLLWNSLQTATPDISFNFEMEFAGYRQPYEATVDAEWDDIYTHRLFSAAVATTYGGAQIKDAMDDLVRSGRIKVNVKGTDEKFDALVGAAQAAIVQAMFDRMDQGNTPGLPQGGDSGGVNLDAAGRYLAGQREESRAQNRETDRQADVAAQREAARRAALAPAAAASAPPGGTAGPAPGAPRTTAAAAGEVARDPLPSSSSSGAASSPSYSSAPAFAVLVSYEMKKVRNRGHYHFEFNRATMDMVHPVFSENIGNLTKWIKDPRVFRSVNLDDELYKQREVMVLLDGPNATDFNKYINFVTVQMRKKHGGGETSTSEVRIDRTNFTQAGGMFRLAPYGWKGDSDRSAWLQYEYNAIWNFFGGKQVETGFQPATSVALALTPPLSRRTLEVDADPAVLTAASVRLVTVNVYHGGGPEAKAERVTIKPAGDATVAVPIEYIRQRGDNRYQYEITWRMRDGAERTSGRREGTADVIFADELPAQTQ